MINTVAIVLIILIAAALLWVGHALVRCGWSWMAVRERISGLKETQVALAKELLDNFRESERLEVEIEDTKKLIETAKQAVAAKRRELETLEAPPLRRVHVTTEVPSAKTYNAWLVRLRRIDAANRAGEESSLYHLVWAPDRDTAASRGSLLAGRQSYQVTQIDRFG